LLGGTQFEWLEWIGLVATVTGLIMIVRAGLPTSLITYSCAVTLLLATNSSLGLKPRCLCWLFPALIGAAAVLRERRSRFLLAGFIGLLPILLIAYTVIGNSLAQP
jgi:hypothetical protein